jgi:isopenicillin N synthase-like dioxygenase
MKSVSLPIVTYGSTTGAHEISSALREWGFFYLRIPDASEILPVIDSLLLDGRSFFELPFEEKQLILMKHLRGYSALGSEVTQGKRDWHECLDFGTEDNERNILNLFPKRPETLEETLNVALTLIPETLGVWVLKCIEEGLQLEKGTLTAPGYFALLRLLHYPHRQENSSDKSIGLGVGEHTDYGFLTFIYSLQQGLEIRLPHENMNENKWGDWVAVPVIKNCLVCNIGDSLSKMTRNVLRATPHRVTYPPTGGPSRVSLAIFCEPPLNRVIKPVKKDNLLPFLRQDTACEEGKDREQEKEEETSYVYGDYLMSKYASSYPSKN